MPRRITSRRFGIITLSTILGRFPRRAQAAPRVAAWRIHGVAVRPAVVPMVSHFVLLAIGLLATQGEPRAQASHSSEPLRVRVEIAPGPHFSGQGFDLEVSVLAAALRPELEPPRIAARGLG